MRAQSKTVRVPKSSRKSVHSPQTDWTSEWWKPALLFIIPVVLFFPSMRSGFVWDDDTHLTGNLLTQPGGLYRSWFTSHQPNYWPLTWSAFWLQWKIFGMNPSGYHVTNILLHALNSVLVWRVLHALPLRAAWPAALLFAVHPVNVETAAWITQLKTLLSMALYCISLLLWLKFDETRDRRSYWSALAFFVAALMSKPSIVMLPVVLLIFIWFRRGRISKADILGAAPFFAAAVIISLTEIWFQTHRSGAGVVVREDSLAARIAGAGWVVWFYLGKALLPMNLSLVYPRWNINPTRILTWIPLMAGLASLALLWWRRHDWGRGPFAALAYYAVTLFPVMGMFNIFYFRYSFVADHWQYQSIPAVTAAAAGIGFQLLQRVPAKSSYLVFAAVVLLLSGTSFKHQFAFRDMETLYRHTISRNSGALLAHSNLGSHLYKQRRMDEARKHLDKALSIDPNDPEANAVLGNLLFDSGSFEAALTHYARALPGMAPQDRFKVHFEMAQTYMQMNRKADAAREFENVLKLRPGFAPARQRLEAMRSAGP